MAELSMESLFVMGKDRAVNQDITQEIKFKTPSQNQLICFQQKQTNKINETGFNILKGDQKLMFSVYLLNKFCHFRKLKLGF